MRSTTVACGLLAACLASCGDNSKQCGEGTNDNDGDNICEPDVEQELICGDGTTIDTLTLECVPSTDVCGGGTVLIDGRCQDPTSDLVLDLVEGPEPNGFELGATPAGTITIKPNNEAFVLHGCITPVDDVPDLDVYDLTVTGPTLIEVSADGVQGLAAGFIAFGDAPQLANWVRLGINVANDTSKRQLFLPAAGRYELVMADTRTLLPLTQNGEGLPAAGNPDGTSCYYVTVAQRPIPSPTTLDLVNGNTGEVGGEVKFFTASFPTGFIALSAVIDPEDLDGDGIPELDAFGNPIDSRAASSLVLMNNNVLRQINDAGNGNPADTPVSTAIFAGIKPGDTPLLVLDHVWNYKIGPAAFAIDIEAATTSQALATDGTAVNATSNGQAFFGEDGGFDKVNQFHFDVAADGQIDGFDLTFSIPVSGSIVDQDGNFASPLTGLLTESNGVPDITTFTSYKGLIRSFAPGRYYWFLITPRTAPNTPFTVTSRIETQTPVAIVTDTLTAQIPHNAFDSNALTYDAGTEPWHRFDGTTQATSLDVQMFDPAVRTPRQPGFAFGRLDPLVVTVNNDPPSTDPGDGTPLLATELGTGAATGRIFRNPFAVIPAAPTDVLFKVRSTEAAPTGTFQLDFQTRVYEDFGGPAIAAGATVNDSGSVAAGSGERYYFETAPGNTVTITVTPAAGTLDPAVVLFDIDENGTPRDGSGAGDAEVLTFTQGPSGFTAFQVADLNGSGAGDYEISVQVESGDYTIASTVDVPFDNACLNGGVIVPLVDDGSGLGDPSDEGLSAEFAPPAGMTLFGTAITSFKISSNGFVTFDTAIPDAAFDNLPLADGLAQHIAPYWDDLTNIVVCMKSVNGKRVIQWQGEDFSFPVGRTVQFQAILDPADDSIEFVYGPAHAANGVGQFDFGATVGIVNASGPGFVELGFDLPLVVRDLSIKLTPN
jgi:hypothetical protein